MKRFLNFLIKKYIFIKGLSNYIYKIFKLYFIVNVQLLKSFNNNYTGLKIYLPQKKIKIKPNENLIDTAIIFQGPIYREFTLDTIERYFEMYPNIKIFYSTWSDECKDTMKILRKLGVKLIISKKPLFKISGNQDLMILSMKRALDEIKNEHSINYLIRHRGDQRISHPNWIEALISLLKIIPSDNSLNDSGKRIITSSGDSGKFRLFMLSDQFQFGTKKDIEDLWDIPIFPIGYRNMIKNSSQFLKDTRLSQIGVKAENYLHYNFYKKLRPEGNWSWRDYMNLIRLKFIVLDDSSLRFEWKRRKLNRFSTTYFQNFFNLNPHIFPNNGTLSGSMSFLDYILLLDKSYGEDYFWSKYTKEKWKVTNDQEPYNYQTEIMDMGGELIE